MVSDPAARARLIRRALTIVAGVVLVLLGWTSTASADDAHAAGSDMDQSRGLIGSVAGVLDDTTSKLGHLVADREFGDRAERESPRGDDRRASQETTGSRAGSAPASREAPPAAETGSRAGQSSESGAAERPRPVLERVSAPISEVTDPILEATRPLTEPTAEQVERVVAPAREGLRPVTRELRPVLEPVGDLLEPVERTLSPVGDLLEPVTVVLRPVGDLVDDVALPTPLVPSEPSTVIPDDGSGPVRPTPALTEEAGAEGVRHSAERGLDESAATPALEGAQSVAALVPSVLDVAGTPSPDGDRLPSPAIPTAATGSGASPAGAGSGGPATADLSDVWTSAAPLALDRPVGRSTTLLTVAAERPGFAPD